VCSKLHLEKYYDPTHIYNEYFVLFTQPIFERRIDEYRHHDNTEHSNYYSTNQHHFVYKCNHNTICRDPRPGEHDAIFQLFYRGFRGVFNHILWLQSRAKQIVNKTHAMDKARNIRDYFIVEQREHEPRQFRRIHNTYYTNIDFLLRVVFRYYYCYYSDVCVFVDDIRVFFLCELDARWRVCRRECGGVDLPVDFLGVSLERKKRARNQNE
jgi:hypothetical protein